MGRHAMPEPELITPPTGVTDARATGVLYLMPEHPDRDSYRGRRRRPGLIARLRARRAARRTARRHATSNPIWTFGIAALVLLSTDVLIVAYARGVTGSFTAAFSDIFAVVLGVTAGWVS